MNLSLNTFIEILILQYVKFNILYSGYNTRFENDYTFNSYFKILRLKFQLGVLKIQYSVLKFQ